jgi:hypothetical protein
MRKQMRRSMESSNYEWEWYDDPSRKPPVETLFQSVTNLLGNHVNHQGEIRKNIYFPRKHSIIKKRLFATCSNASNIKVTLTMRLDLLPHEARHVVF